MSKCLNNFTAIVPCEVLFADAMQSLLSYAQRCEESCGVCFIVVLIMYIINAMMLSNIMVPSSRAITIISFRAGRMRLKHEDVS